MFFDCFVQLFAKIIVFYQLDIVMPKPTKLFNYKALQGEKGFRINNRIQLKIRKTLNLFTFD